MRRRLILVAALPLISVALPAAAQSTEFAASDASGTAEIGKNCAEVPELSSFANERRAELIDAGVRKIEANTNKRTVHVSTTTSGVFFHWPKNVKPVTVNIMVPQDGPVIVAANGYSSPKADQYRDAVEALISRAVGYAKQQTLETVSPSLRAPR
jgi:hypothetical protein